MNSLKKSIAGIAGATAGLFTAAMSTAWAQGTAAAPPHHHVVRYVVLAVVVIAVIVALAMRAKNSKKQTA